MRRADIEVPNRGVDVNSRPRSACYPQSTFYPLSDGPSTGNRRITRSRFRVCSTCPSRSEACFYPCARRTVADRAEQTFELTPKGSNKQKYSKKTREEMRRICDEEAVKAGYRLAFVMNQIFKTK